jgi:hypothetical protein
VKACNKIQLQVFNGPRLIMSASHWEVLLQTLSSSVDWTGIINPGFHICGGLYNNAYWVTEFHLEDE